MKRVFHGSMPPDMPHKCQCQLDKGTRGACSFRDFNSTQNSFSFNRFPVRTVCEEHDRTSLASTQSSSFAELLPDTQTQTLANSETNVACSPLGRLLFSGWLSCGLLRFLWKHFKNGVYRFAKDI